MDVIYLFNGETIKICLWDTRISQKDIISYNAQNKISCEK